MAEPIYVTDSLGNPRRVEGPDAAESVHRFGASPIGRDQALAEQRASDNLSYVDKNWGTLGTAALGVGSGLSLGLLPGLLSKWGLADPGHISAAQASPWYTAGDVAGTVAPALLSGGESLALRMTPAGLMGAAGSLSERVAAGLMAETPGLMGRLGSAPLRMAARGATEGALINLGHTVGDSLVQNKPLAAEALLASAQDGALFGGLLGGSIGSLGVAAEEGLGGLRKGLGKVSGGNTSRIAKSLGVSTDELSAIEAKGGAGAVKDFYKRSGDILESSGSSIGDSASGKADAVRKYIKTQEAVQSDVITNLTKFAPETSPTVDRVIARIETDLSPKLMSTDGPLVQREIENVSNRIRSLSEIQKLDEVKVPATKPLSKAEFEAKQTGPTHLRESYETYKSNLDQGYTIRGGEFPVTKPTWEAWSQARKDLAQSLTGPLKQDILNAVDSEIRFAMEDAAKLSSMKELEGLADSYGAASQNLSFAAQMEANLGKKVAESMLTSTSALTAGDVGNAVGMSLINPFVAAGWLGTKAVNRMVSRRMEPWMAQMAYNNMLGVDAASATTTARNKIGSSIKKFFKNSTKEPVKAASAYGYEKRPQSEEHSRKSYEASSARARELVSQAHQDRVNRHLNRLVAQGYADLAGAMAGVNAKAVQYLLWNMPPGNFGKQLGSLRKKPLSIAPTLQEYKFNRIHKAVTNPFSILEDLEKGSVSRDAVGAIKYVYPELHTELVNTATEQIYELKAQGKYLPLNKISELSIVLDAPLDSTMESEYINAVQVALNTPSPEELEANPPPQPPMPLQAGMQAQGLMTPLQSTQMMI